MIYKYYIMSLYNKMLFKKYIGTATIMSYNYKNAWCINHKLYSLQRLQIEYPDETELLNDLLDIFDDDIIDTLWGNHVYFIDLTHNIH